MTISILRSHAKTVSAAKALVCRGVRCWRWLGAGTMLAAVVAGCNQQPPAPAPPMTPETKPDVKPQSVPQTQPQTQPQPKPATKPDAPPEAPAAVTPNATPSTTPASTSGTTSSTGPSATGGATASPPAVGAPASPWPTPANAPLPTMEVKLAGKTFKLEKAMDDTTRFGGLSGRTEIASDGGMIFVFRNAQPLAFVMRDCPIPIDIIYVDATGRITAMHHMTPEPPRADDEKVQAGQVVNNKYELRLKRYPSRFAAVIAIELRANTLNINGSNPNGLALKVGDKLDLDIAALRAQAK